jgi:elongation factor P
LQLWVRKNKDIWIMKIDGVSIRVGNVLEHKKQLWVVTKTQHVKPGKGGAFNQVEMKDIRNGTKLNERFRSDESVERVRLEQVDYQFLYAEGDDLVFMNQTDYEQISLPADLLGDSLPFLEGSMMVTIELYESEPISVTLPQHVTLEVTETEPVIKGQTVSSSYKPAILSNGVRITVPPFISVGDKIVVDTGEVSYVERA